MGTPLQSSQREIMLFIGKPKGRSRMFSNDMLVTMTTSLDFNALRLHPFIVKIDKVQLL